MESSVSSKLLAVVFTDLEGSTALKSERGDMAAAELIERHHTLVRELLTQEGGREIDNAGDAAARGVRLNRRAAARANGTTHRAQRGIGTSPGGDGYPKL